MAQTPSVDTIPPRIRPPTSRAQGQGQSGRGVGDVTGCLLGSAVPQRDLKPGWLAGEIQNPSERLGLSRGSSRRGVLALRTYPENRTTREILSPIGKDLAVNAASFMEYLIMPADHARDNDRAAVDAPSQGLRVRLRLWNVPRGFGLGGVHLRDSDVLAIFLELVPARSHRVDDTSHTDARGDSERA